MTANITNTNTAPDCGDCNKSAARCSCHEGADSEPAEIVVRGRVATANQHPAPTTEQLAKAAQLRAEAAADIAKREESHDRCDTDGFLTQWAHGLNAQERATQAEILEHGGCAKFIGLFDSVTGERVPAKIISGNYGARWMICDPVTGRATGIFYALGSINEDGTPVNSPRTKLCKAGLEERIEWAPAVAKCVGSGRGLSGSAWIATLRTDGGWPGAPQWRVDEDARNH